MKNGLILFVLTLAFSIPAWAQTNVGIGNNAPLTKLDISGALSVREGSALSTLSTGNNNNVTLPLVPATSDVTGFCRITAPTGGPFTITGIVPNTGANGQIITLINTTGKVMTIVNASASSSTVNRIYTQTGASLVDNASATSNSSITMQYSQNAGGTGVAGWMVTATQNFSISNAQLANSGITITNGVGISISGSPVTLGGTVTVTNTGVTSVGMAMPGIFTVTGSPVTTTGTLTAALASEIGNTIFAAPNGSAGSPAFRALVAADIPVLNQNTTGTAAGFTGLLGGDVTGAQTSTVVGAIQGQPVASSTPVGGQVLEFNSGTGKWTPTTTGSSLFTAGTGLSWSGSTLNNTGVTSVALAMPGIFTVSGSPVTTTGTLTAALASESGNTVFAAPNGSAGNPTFRALVAADVPTLNQSTTGNAATATNVAISGLTAATATNTIDNLNYAQTWNWSTASAQTPLSINANGLSSGTGLSLASTSTAGTASGSSTLLNIARSGANANTAHTAYGVYSTVTNTNATSGTNVAGYFSASGATTANYGLLVAAGNVGIGTVSPSAKFHVNGDEIVGTNYTAITANSFASNILNIVTPTVMTTNAIATPESGLRLMRTGTNGVKYNASAEIDLGTYAAGLAAQSSIKFRLGNGNSHVPDADIMILQGNGNVGIGITAPAATLDVLSSNANGIALDATSGGQGYMLYYGGTSSAAGSLKAAMALAGANGSWSTDALPTDLIIRTSGALTGGTGSPKQKILFNTNGGSGNSTMAINGSNVGIGDTLPTQPLDVNGTGLFRNGNTGSSFTNNQILFGYAGTATYQHAIKTRHNSGAAAGNDIDFYTWNYGTDASGTAGTKYVMTMDGTGNVGIGVTSPAITLDVSGSMGIKGAVWDHMYMTHDGSTGYLRVGGAETNGLALQVSSTNSGAYGTQTYTNVMNLTADGNVHIGDATNATQPYILPTSGTSLRIGNSSGGQCQDIFSNYFYCLGKAFFGGTSSPTNMVDAYGSMSTNTGNSQPNYIGSFRNVASGGGAIYLSTANLSNSGRWLQLNVGGTEEGCLYNNGSTGASIFSASDQRLKTNIRNTSLGLSAIMQMKVRDYEWKVDGKTVNAGFIAQELYDVYPAAVLRGSDGALDSTGTWMVNYAGITPLLTKAIQDQQVEIEQLKTANASLQEENSMLKSSKADVLYVNQLKAQLDDLKTLMEKNGIRAGK